MTWAKTGLNVLSSVLLVILDRLTHSVPLSIIVLLSVENFLLATDRQADPSLGHIQSQMAILHLRTDIEQQALS